MTENIGRDEVENPEFENKNMVVALEMIGFNREQIDNIRNGDFKSISGVIKPTQMDDDTLILKQQVEQEVLSRSTLDRGYKIFEDIVNKAVLLIVTEQYTVAEAVSEVFTEYIN